MSSYIIKEAVMVISEQLSNIDKENDRLVTLNIEAYRTLCNEGSGFYELLECIRYVSTCNRIEDGFTSIHTALPALEKLVEKYKNYEERV